MKESAERSVGQLVGYISAGSRRYTNCWFRVPSEPMAIFFLSRLLCVLKWGFLYNYRGEGSDCYWALALRLGDSSRHSNSPIYWLLKVCWSSPAQLLLFPSSTEPMTLFYMGALRHSAKTLHTLCHTQLTLTTLPWKQSRLLLGRLLLTSEIELQCNSSQR
jgi:hypothetical protein